MSRKHYSRRTFLRGMAGGAVITLALPIFEHVMNSSGTAFATGEAFPKRFGLFFWGNGVLPSSWTPTGSGTSYTLTEQLAPLASVKNLITVVSGTSIKTPNLEPHDAGACGILTGAPLKVDGEHKTFPVATIDQVIAAEIGANSAFRSIEFGAAPGRGQSYNGPDNQNPPETSPLALFDRIFGSGFYLPGAGGAPNPRLALRRSVLDSALDDANALNKRLGKTDRARLDQHLSGVRDLEKRILYMEEHPPNLLACTTDALPPTPAASYPDINGRKQLSVLNRVMTDIIVMALACDQTRVFSNFFTAPVNNMLFPNAPAGHHQLTHDEPGDQPAVNAIVKQIIAEYAYVVQKLQSISEGSETLLDHTIMLGTTDTSLGRTHSLDDFPILLAGSAGGRLKQGIHYRAPAGENASKVLLSILHAMDINAGEFGVDEGRVTSGLGGIEV